MGDSSQVAAGGGGGGHRGNRVHSRTSASAAVEILIDMRVARAEDSKAEAIRLAA